MNMYDADFLGVLLDAATDTRLILLTGDEARPAPNRGTSSAVTVQAQPLEPERTLEDAAPVDGPVGTDLSHHLRADQDRVQDFTGPHAAANRTPVHGSPEPSWRPRTRSCGRVRMPVIRR
ncbi:hypothetical protein [Streptomyces xanthophaeus]|uniref:hypothetical protein n=1 Tax=Streptomyces xanthophaeus TaxID=67385 RepID=UPI00364F27C5